MRQTVGVGGLGVAVVGCAASVLREEMLICSAFRHRRSCRCSFVSCSSEYSTNSICCHYKRVMADWYRFWYRLQYRRYRYQTDTTGIGPIPIPSTGIGLSLVIINSWTNRRNSQLRCKIATSIKIVAVCQNNGNHSFREYLRPLCSHVHLPTTSAQPTLDARGPFWSRSGL